MSIIRIGLSQTKQFADGYDAIFSGKKQAVAKKVKAKAAKKPVAAKKKPAKKKKK